VNPLWRTAPFVLRRFPGVLVALVAAAALLALAAAAGPLFVSASASAAVGDELRRLTGFGAGAYVRVTGPVAPADVQAVGDPTLVERTRLLERTTAGWPGVGGVVATVLAPEVAAAGASGDGELEVRLLARTGALDHVERLQGGGSGLWLADTTAEQLRLVPGDRVRLGLGTTERTVAVRVAGLYRTLARAPRTPFWRSLEGEIYPAPPAFATPPTFAIGDQETVSLVSAQLGLESADFRWEIPLDSRELSLADARAVSDELGRLGEALETEGDPLFELFVCRRCLRGIRTEYSTGMPGAVAAAEASAATVRGPVDLLANAGSLVALLVVAAVGAFSLARRRVETAVLFARGTGPGSTGARLALEAVLPVLAGTVAGAALAYALVTAVGPDGAVDRDGLGDAFRAAALRVPAALVVLGLVGAAWSHRLARAGEATGRRRLPVPWEVPVLAGAAFCFFSLVNGEAFTAAGDAGVSQPSSYLLLFPILLLVGVAGLGARLLRRAVAAWRDRSTSSSEAVYLATHRLASARILLVLLVTACALALGMFAYAEAVVSSYRATVQAASLLGTGSDVSGLTSYDRSIPDLPVPVTKATKLGGDGTIMLGSLPVDVLAIDAATFADAVHWDDSYASRPLAEIIATLGEGGSPLPAALVGGELEGVQALTTPTATATSVRVIARPRAFPGMSRRRATVVVDAAAYEAAFDEPGLDSSLGTASARTELWAKGETARTVRLLDASPARPYPILTAEEARNRPETVAFTRTFGFLEALGLAAGLLALVGLVVYLQVRQRARVVGFGLARRMGLSARSHRRALALELGLAVIAAFALGLGTALLAARLVMTQVEPLASISPMPLFEPPLAEAGVALVVLGVVTLAGAALADRAAARANLAEVLRLGE
jgi:putative ABC transport system permease protein